MEVGDILYQSSNIFFFLSFPYSYCGLGIFFFRFNNPFPAAQQCPDTLSHMVNRIIMLKKTHKHTVVIKYFLESTHHDLKE